MELLARRRIIGEKMMISEVRLEAGCRVPTHSHENEQISWVTEGKLRFGIGEEGTPERTELIVAAGEVLHLPANLPHSAEAIEASLVIDLFAPPSEGTGIDAHGRA